MNISVGLSGDWPGVKIIVITVYSYFQVMCGGRGEGQSHKTHNTLPQKWRAHPFLLPDGPGPSFSCLAEVPAPVFSPAPLPALPLARFRILPDSDSVPGHRDRSSRIEPFTCSFCHLDFVKEIPPFGRKSSAKIGESRLKSAKNRPKFERGEKTPTPKISALLRKRPVLLKAHVVLTKDQKRPYSGHFCGKTHGQGSCSKAAGGP